MQAKFKFRLSALTLGVMGALVGGQAMAADTYQDLVWSNGSVEIRGNNDNLGGGGEGVFIRSNAGSAASYADFTDQGVVNVVGSNTTVSGSSHLYLNSPITAINNAATVGSTLGVGTNLTVGGTTTVTGATTLNGATTVNNTLTVTGTTNINAGSTNTTNIGTGASASVNNIGGAASINTITGLTNNVRGITNINDSVNSATNINTGTSTAAVTVGNSANTTNLNSATNNIGSNGFATTNNIGAGSSSFASTNRIGNTNAGTTAITTAGNSVVTTKNNAASTVVTGASGTSNLDGGTTTSGGSAVLLKGGIGTQTVVDVYGKLTNVTGTATQSTASLTLTNGAGNVHGLVVTETQASLSGGTNSSTLTTSDNGATFSDARNGNPVQVHGVDDGTAQFDAVNVRQFAGAIASVTAMANIPQVDQDKTYAMGVGVGTFMGRSALAAGVTYRFTANGVLKGSVSSAMTNSNSTTVGFGAAWSY